VVGDGAAAFMVKCDCSQIFYNLVKIGLRIGSTNKLLGERHELLPPAEFGDHTQTQGRLDPSECVDVLGPALQLLGCSTRVVEWPLEGGR
jgi:hypothetical protein